MNCYVSEIYQSISLTRAFIQRPRGLLRLYTTNSVLFVRKKIQTRKKSGILSASVAAALRGHHGHRATTWGCPHISFHYVGQILVHVPDRLDVVLIYENIQHARTDERRQAWPEPYVLNTQIQQGQQDHYSLLLIPG